MTTTVESAPEEVTAETRGYRKAVAIVAAALATAKAEPNGQAASVRSANSLPLSKHPKGPPRE